MPRKRIAPSQKNCKRKECMHKETAPQEIKIDVNSIKKMFKKTEINKIAQKTGFIKRVRKLDAYKFFLSLTFGALKGSTVTLSSIVEDLSKKISRASVNERFTETACCFLREVYSYLFKVINTAKKNINVDLLNKFNAIQILDSSSWQLPKALKDAFAGYNKAGCKIQVMMDYKTGALSLFDLTKETRNDQSYAKDICHDINANDLCIFDLGYVVAKAIINIHKKMAFFYRDLISSAFHCIQKEETNFIRLIF